MMKNELTAYDIPGVLTPSGEWNEQRRNEVLEILIKNLYGHRPPAPAKVEFKEYSIDECEFTPGTYEDSMYEYFKNADNAVFKKVKIICHLSENDFPGVKTYLEAEGKFEFDVSCYLPKIVEGEKIPATVAITYRESFDSYALPMKDIVEKNVAVFAFRYRHIVNDYPERNTPGREHPQFDDTGLDRLFYGDYRLNNDPAKRKDDDPGTIGFWSWAASRVMDYVQTQSAYIDLERVAVSGHSRLGKTALYTGALDKRFTHILSSASCAAGASLTRVDTKETLKSATKFTEWFCNNLKSCCENPPFDMHFLLACIAPRKLYISNSDNDEWCDQNAEYLSCIAASEVYENLGMKGFIHPDRFPVPGDIFNEGDIGYHLREGIHAFQPDDWMKALEFFCLN